VIINIIEPNSASLALKLLDVYSLLLIIVERIPFYFILKNNDMANPINAPYTNIYTLPIGSFIYLFITILLFN
jgi:hypothetical protein